MTNGRQRTGPRPPAGDSGRSCVRRTRPMTSSVGGPRLRRPGRITCAVLMKQAKIAAGQLPAVMHGARIQSRSTAISNDCIDLSPQDDRRGCRDRLDCKNMTLETASTRSHQGQKTAAFEIVDALCYAPDVHALPVGKREPHPSTG